MRLRKPIVLSFFVLAVLLTMSAPAFAQTDGIVLQVSVPEWMQQVFDETLFDQFEAENPGVTVQMVRSANEAFFPPVSMGLDAHLDKVAEYAAMADVLYLDGDSLSVEATRAGYFLDLTPLTSSDPTLNSADFFPAAWQSFQWDGGLWALPVSLDVVSVIYDPAAFDSAGLAYPADNWSIDDYANAARNLAQRDSNGDVTTPGLILMGSGAAPFIRSVVGEGLYDDSVLPNVPRFTNPNLETVMTTWMELENEGVATYQFNGQPDTVPMRVMPSFGLGMGFMNADANQTPPQAALLPGGVSGLSVEGFAISKGTAYPEQAYALVKYLTSNPQAATAFFGASPARQSLVNVQPTPPEGDGPIMMRPTSPEMQMLIERALPVALPVSELRFSTYLINALDRMNEGVDAHTALQQVEAQAATNLQSAANIGTTSVLYVATPVPAPVLGPNEIALRFGMTSFMMPMPNRDEWDRLMDEFIAADPQVGQIIMDTEFMTAEEYAEEYDCFYLPYNAVPNVQLDTLLNLDPFMDADPTFDRNDIAGNLLPQLQRDNKTWALPISIEPAVLRYNTELFAQAGVPFPENGWTIDAFNDALRMLRPTADAEAPFVPQDIGGGVLLTLIAAYGGLPLDYRTTTPTIDFTSPATVDAIRQVLDLAKDGYIEYSEQARTSIMISSNGEDDKAIYSASLNGINIRITVGGGPENNPYRFATYPRGSQFGALSYGIGTAYISANTQNPDACYRWLSFISLHPELFSSMPARRSLINDPALAAAQGADSVAIYNQIDALLQDPSTIVIPQPSPASGALSGFMAQLWLSRAFDNYVLHDADLEAELADAELYARAFLECAANIPPYDPLTGNQQTYFQQYADCATSVDSSLGAFFGIGG